jgi:hypothetical protein
LQRAGEKFVDRLEQQLRRKHTTAQSPRTETMNVTMAQSQVDEKTDDNGKQVRTRCTLGNPQSKN